MATKPLTVEQCREVLDALARCGNTVCAAASMGIPRSTFSSRLQEARRRLDGQVHRTVEMDHRMNLSVDNGRVVVFSDAHYQPGNASTAHRALLEIIKEVKPVGVVANGDLVDGAQTSRFPRIGWQRQPTVKEELDAVTERLSEIEVLTKKRGVWRAWLHGNHDTRFDTFLAANAPQYEQIDGFSLKSHFPLWQMALRMDINAGGIGHTVVKHRWRGGIHATRNNAINSGVNFVSSHLHSPKVNPITNARGTLYGVDTGTLACVNSEAFVDYTEDNIKDWRSGFAVLTFRNGRLLHPELCLVHSEEAGIVEFRGEEFLV